MSSATFVRVRPLEEVVMLASFPLNEVQLLNPQFVHHSIVKEREEK